VLAPSCATDKLAPRCVLSEDMKINFPSHLTDTALVAAVMRLAGGEREATVQLITYLAELDRRRLYLPAGYSSLYAYCRSELQLSEPEAYIRMKAARIVRRFPRILEMLIDGSLNLTTLRLLVPHLKSSNHQGLLDAAAGKSKREVKELLARLFPKPDARPSIRKLPAPRPSLAATATLATPGAADVVLGVSRTVTESPARAQPPASPSPHHPLAMPLAADRYKITFTASTETRDKLEFARDLLRHAIPDGDPAAIIDRALMALLEELARNKFAAADKPRPGRGPANGSRHIPADVKRAVWIRDLGRCAFVAPHGRRCNERAFVEFHHVQPYAAGGPPTVVNIALRCKSHNQHEADVYFGPRSGVDAVRETAAAYAAGIDVGTGSGPT